MRFFMPILAGLSLCTVHVHSQFNVNSKKINFRTLTTASGNTTEHYGDLKLMGPEGSNANSSWGWLYANQIISYGRTSIYGNLDVYGSIYSPNPKNFIHPHPTDTTKVIRYSAIESGEVLTLARGTGKTLNGNAIIDLPDHFGMVTNDDIPLSVLITPEGAPAVLFVKSKSEKQLEFAMRNSDLNEFGDVNFSYQVSGVRDGFENYPVILNTSDLDNPVGSVKMKDKIKTLNQRLKKLKQR